LTPRNSATWAVAAVLVTEERKPISLFFITYPAPEPKKVKPPSRHLL
jgi:hypothetical protein